MDVSYPAGFPLRQPYLVWLIEEETCDHRAHKKLVIC